MQIIGFDDAEPLLDWVDLAEFMAECHRNHRPILSDQLIEMGENSLLNRIGWIYGYGSIVKTAFVIPSNKERGLPTTTGAAILFDDRTGELKAVLDFKLVTKWKTAADSLLAAKLLARRNSSKILIIGAGAVARSAIEAYSSFFLQAEFHIWNRTVSHADAVVAEYSDRTTIETVSDLATAVRNSDIIVCATMSVEPLILGQWLSEGTHVDLIGAFRPDMREADDATLQRARIFVDSRETTSNIGEIMLPMKAGIIGKVDIIADFNDIADGRFRRKSANEITVFKNGGGAHLDLMTAAYILRRQNEHH